MFTGIVAGTGTVISREARGDLRVRIRCEPRLLGDPGASVACDGISLTIAARGGDWFDVDLSAQTQADSHIGAGAWQPGARVNLERPVRVGDELGGHILSGHVDGAARIVALEPVGDSVRVTLAVAPELVRYLAPRGSVALNGTSLSIAAVDAPRRDPGAAVQFSVNLIPYTLMATNWADARAGDPVAIEIDMLARYVARLAAFAAD